MPLPSEIVVRETSEGTHFVLPHRCPARIRSSRGCAVGCGFPLGVVGFLITAGLLAEVGPTLRSDGLAGLLLAGLVFSPVAALGLALFGAALWLLLGGRSELRLSTRTFRMRERLGPLFFSRRVPTSGIAAFRAKSLGMGLSALEVDLISGESRRWAVQYPAAWIEALASELTRRRDALGGGGPGIVKRKDDGLRVVLPARGLWFAGKTLLVLAAVGVTLACASVVVLQDHLAGALRADKHVPGLAFSGTAWIAFAAWFYLAAREVVVFEYTGKILRVTHVTPLRRRVREWARSDVWGFEIAYRNRSDDPNTARRRPHLVARLSNGKRPVLLQYREETELHWVVAMLRRGRNASETGILEARAVTTTSGTCQVCSSAMEDNLVTCARCATPHHRECWDYTGMCSTYGCREIRVLGPRT